MTFCLAVGASGVFPNRFRALVEQWGGRTFSVAPSPTPEGSELLGVSCRTRTFCIAVGLNGVGASSELWNGSGWRVLATPSPTTGGRDTLTSVSCLSRTDCWSVGIENSGTARTLPLVEHWNDARWSLVPSPTAPTTQLYSVDCPSVSSYWIVGMKDTAAAHWHPLVEHGNGRAIVPGPLPAPSDYLSAISCAQPTT